MPPGPMPPQNLRAQNLRATGDRIESLLDGLRGSLDPRTFEQVEELLRLVSDLYGGGLTRIVQLAGDQGPAMMQAMVDDDLVASLLLVHDLHPVSLAVRVEAALSSVRPLLATHGGDVELLDLDSTARAVRLRLLGSCDGCPSSSVTLQSAVEQAIVEAAPEIVVIDVDQPTSSAGVPIKLGVKPVYDSCPSGVAP
ncbi:MAG: NifU family protein [Acidimicrobiaceae bacterium]|nr:NifU family protein [Acidimicrobiaceae bacterium]